MQVIKSNWIWPCALSVIILAIVAPTIHRYLYDPNLIYYFSHDEGYLMDLIWSYFSGEYRMSFRGDYDYGLEMIYIADFCRLILAPFIDFTPGTFVFILRWLHLLFWIASIWALWILMGNHFSKGWQRIFVVLLLAVRPAFSYLMLNSKPEPVVLFFLIVGLNYVLHYIDQPKQRFIFLATACSAVAFIVKFAGLFLIPTIIVAMLCSETYHRHHVLSGYFSKVMKYSWIFPSLIGLSMSALSFLGIFFYVRKSTGLTFYQQHGLLGSMTQLKFVKVILLLSGLCVCISGLLWFFSKKKNKDQRLTIIENVNTKCLIIGTLFVGFVLLFGFRWLISPHHFINTFSQFSHLFLATGGGADLSLTTILEYIRNFFQKITEFDALIFLLFIIYIFTEIGEWKKQKEHYSLGFLKRLTLISFLIPFFFALIPKGQFHTHHMLPFFVVMSILILQGIGRLKKSFFEHHFYQKIILVIMAVFLTFDIVYNGSYVVRSRLYQFKREHDVAFEIENWWKTNVADDVPIISDHPAAVFMPSYYNNIQFFRFSLGKRVEDLPQMVKTFQPKYFYYNAGPAGDRPLPSVTSMLPGVKMKHVKTFTAEGKDYQRGHPGDKFVIYKIVD